MTITKGMLFTEGDGVIFRNNTQVEIDDLELKLPCFMALRAAKRLVITEVDGLTDTVKEDMGFSGWAISLASEIGDYDAPFLTFLGREGISASRLLAALNRLVKKKGPLKISDRDHLLRSLGINSVMIEDLQVEPLKRKRYRFTLSMLSDITSETDGDKLDLFLAEE